MKTISTMLTALMLLLSLPSQAKIEHLLPRPQKVTQTTGATPFALHRNVSISYNDETANCPLLEQFFADYGCTSTTNAEATVKIEIVDFIDDAYDYDLFGFDNEAYTLEITENEIKITAITKTGVIRATQTLMQLAEGYENGNEELEALTMTDWPAFKLRGFMHDVGRSFVSVDEIKSQIDLMSRFKVNTFHWHMTENQAWRFEVKQYPQLTESQHMTRFEGQYYTQEQCADVEAYAAERGVIVIPEIDMPGHSEAFVRAMGHDMQTDEGVEELQNILTEVANVFTRAPYIHIGADEKTITYTDFLKIMTDKVHELGKNVVVWNPISGVSINADNGFNMEKTMTQMWSTSGRAVSGIPNIDCRYNYTNHFDVFADLVGIYKSNIYYAEKGSSEIAGTISAPWNDRKTPTQEDIIKQNNIYANTLASTERAWIGGGRQYIEVGGTTLPNSGDEYEEFADWERRFLFHKANSLKEKPIPYVKQTNIRWRITDAFPNEGDNTMEFPAELPATDAEMSDSYTYNGETYYTRMATGAAVYLRHTWGSTIPTFFNNPQLNTTAYAWTYVYSENERTLGANIEFQNYGRSEKDKAPDTGKWDRKGSKIWINGTEIEPPTWDNSGKTIDNEVELQNENFSAREPIEVKLNAGWNKVLLKLPYVSADGIRLNKWMFTFVLTDLETGEAADGLIYSPGKSTDEKSEIVSAKISEIERNRSAYIGTLPGRWDTSLANELDEKIASVKETLRTEMSAEARESQITELDKAYEAFIASLNESNMNQPIASDDASTTYYRIYTPLRDNRYPTSKGAGNAIIGETNPTTKASVWKFVSRNDNTFDIVNAADGTYISPASSNNTALTTVAERPSQGWTLKPAQTTGYVTITSGNVQFNQTNSGQSYKVYNWGSGTNTTDGGCQYKFIDITDEMPPPPLVSISELSGTTHPYLLDADLTQKIFSAEDLTIAIDIATTATSGKQVFICATDTSQTSLTSSNYGASTFVAIGKNGTTLVHYLTAKDGQHNSKGSISAGKHKIVIVMDKTNNKYYSYIDGTLQSDVQAYQGFNQFKDLENAAIYIGGGVTSAGSKWVGDNIISSVQFFNKALDANAISLIEYPQTAEDIAVGNAISNNSNMNIFGLQRHFGLVQNGGTGITGDGQYICNYPAQTSQESGNAYANLLDNTYTTFFHSGYNTSRGDGTAHYLQANLTDAVKTFRFYYKKRSQNNNNRPTEIEIQGSNEADGEYTTITTINTGLPTDANTTDYFSDAVTCDTKYSYLRFVVKKTNGDATSGNPFFTFSEFYILKNSIKVAETFDAVRAYRNKASIETAKALNDVYTWNKALTEGTPIDGQDHYLYSDTYNNGAFVNRYLYNNNGSLALNTELTKNADSYTWTAALTSDGNYTLKNKAGKYLAHKSLSDNAYNFTISTENKSHLGVTLYSVEADRYMVTKNDGTSFDQSTSTYNQKSGNWNTDYVFIPSDLYQGYNLNIVSNYPACNGVYTWNGEEFTSVSFLEENKEITTTTLAVKECHNAYKFIGFYSDAEYNEPLGTTVDIEELTADKTIYAKYELNIFSDAYGEKWLRATLVNNSGYSMYMTSADNYNGAAPQTHANDFSDAGELCCFVGDANSFKIYYMNSGEEYALTTANATANNGVATQMTTDADATSWHLVDKTDEEISGFCISPDGTDDYGLNSYGGTGKSLKLYQNSDQGNRWIFDIINTNGLTFNLAVDGTPAATNTKAGNITIGYDNFTQNIAVTSSYGNTEKLYYLPKGTKVNISKTEYYRGYDFSGFIIDNGEAQESIEEFEVPENGLRISATFTANDDPARYIYYSPDANNKPYRIPAIAVAPNGNIFAISDNRPCGMDIGYGEVDIKCRISTDNGTTWGDEFYIANGQGGNSNAMETGFGDAAIVADCEQNKLLVMMVCGRTVCWSGRWDAGKIGDSDTTAVNRVARVYATYNETENTWEWSQPEEVTDDIYSLFLDENNQPTVTSMFIGSGKIAQSRRVKAGEYYRLYCSMWTRDGGNRVIYSDDFGGSWKVLGSIDDRPASSGDEPKCEELPNGDVLLSSRKGGGRYFNIYTYSDIESGEGKWSSVVSSNSVSNGLSFGSNSTNGEVLVVKVSDKTTKEKKHLLFQSLPTGNDRSKVAIYYKVLEDSVTYTPTTISQDWTLAKQVSERASAYSTMDLQNDGKIGFFFEENPGEYSMVYIPYTIEELTGDTYTIITEPEYGKFYRLQGYSSKKYMCATTLSQSSIQMSMVADTIASTIFYLNENNQLLSYTEGTFTQNTHSIGAIGSDNQNSNIINFQKSGMNGYYILYTNYSGSKYIYDNNTKVDRNSSYKADNCDWSIHEVTALPLTIGSTGYSTLYAPVSLRIPADVTAYTATRDGEYIDLTPVENIIPKNTAVIIKANSGTYYLNIHEDYVSPIENNELSGSIETFSASSISSPYTLQTETTESQGVVLRKYTGSNLKGFKIYMDINDDEASILRFRFNDITAIEEIKENRLKNSNIYDLFGRQISEATKGIYIINGEKVIINKEYNEQRIYHTRNRNRRIQ